MRYSNNTLLSFTKAELIEQLRCAEHNQKVAEERLAQQAENVKDWVPVVRCGECRFSRELNKCEKKIYLDNCRACECSEASQDGYMIVFPEHFCSYGERREPNEE